MGIHSQSMINHRCVGQSLPTGDAESSRKLASVARVCVCEDHATYNLAMQQGTLGERNRCRSGTRTTPAEFADVKVVLDPPLITPTPSDMIRFDAVII